VGGGSEELRRRIAAQALALRCTVLKEYEDGQSNIRDLLLVERMPAWDPPDCMARGNQS
jgi:hypothetical protein